MGGKKSNHIKKFLAGFKTVRTWQLLLILIPLCFLAATLLRFDHLKMVELKNQVLIADQLLGTAADEAEVAAANAALQDSLTQLQDFAFSHIVINTAESNGVERVIFGTGPFYLEQQYLRAANAAVEQAEQAIVDDSNPHGNIYAAVSAICRPLAIANGWAWNTPEYVNCWTTELAKYPASDNLEVNLTANLPSTELFRHNYASPLWAPTWSGLVLALVALLLVIIFIRFLIWLILKIALLFVK